MGMVMLPPGVTWEQYNYWLQNTPEGQQYAQYVNQAGAGNPTGVSHAPPMQHPGAFRPIAPPAGPSVPQPAPLEFSPVTPLPVDDAEQESPEEQWRNAQPGMAQPIQPQSQGTPYGQPPQWDPQQRYGYGTREEWRAAGSPKGPSAAGRGMVRPSQPQSQWPPLRPPVGVNRPVVNPPLAGPGDSPPQMKPPPTTPKWGFRHLF